MKNLYKAQRLEIEIANGLDSAIEEREGVLKMLLINEALRTHNG